MLLATMGTDKEILSAAALGSGVETLRAGLTSFESSTGQMKSIFEDFEGRLNKLEREMLPMKDISAKLTIARRNITTAIAKVVLWFCGAHRGWVVGVVPVDAVVWECC